MKYIARFSGNAHMVEPDVHTVEIADCPHPEDAYITLCDSFAEIMSLRLYPVERFTLAELRALPTTAVGHTDDCKIDYAGLRVWLSRMTVEDGAPYNNQVTVEVLTAKGWETREEYEAK